MFSSIEKLHKCLKTESDRKYDNRGVIGGLDKLIPLFEKEAKADQINDELIQTIIDNLNLYPQVDRQGREEIIDQILTLTQNVRTGSSSPSGQQSPSSIRSDKKLVGTASVVSSSQIRPTVPTRSGPEVDSRRAVYSGGDARSNQGLSASVTVISGIGPQNAKLLENLGISTIADLLYYTPRKYDDYSALKPINRLVFGEQVTIIASVHHVDVRKVHGGKMTITEAVVTDGTGFVRLSWFNQEYRANLLKVNSQWSISGKVDQYLGRMVMNSPDVEPLEQAHLNTNRIVPVYPLTAGIRQNNLRSMIHKAVSYWVNRIEDFMPNEIVRSASLMDLRTALSQIHYPDNFDKLRLAQNRLAFDEIFLLQLGVLRQKQTWQAAQAKIFETPDDWLELQMKRLPFVLTGSQRKVINEVKQDIASGHPMNRMLQGDVGSGKTVVAALAIAMITRHGGQAAFMAPTSILADQHYRSLKKLLASEEIDPESPLEISNIRLLIGDTSEIEKQEIRTGLADGSIKLIIGTHALIEDPILFDHLQLVIIDEQHRFGVEQRAALRSKGENPHMMVMSATPIPRSLALTVYGDLELSVLDEMPVGRLPIETQIVHPIDREWAYQRIISQVEQRHQAFIIFPLVEKTETDLDENKAAVDEHAHLQKEVFPHYKLGLMHGRLKPEEKDQVMKKFRDGEYQILISTSVVEVGVDIPNATIMMIESANRFGLSQLHQFRGRVGRGDIQSYCYLLPDNEDSLENERLAVMAETNDGFVLAERDLEQRGPGDFLGTRQSGYSELRMANLTNIRLIEKAREQAQTLYLSDSNLSDPQHEALARTFARFWSRRKGEIS
jgi:ATP-dependent DNA helicase RecG